MYVHVMLHVNSTGHQWVSCHTAESHTCHTAVTMTASHTAESHTCHTAATMTVSHTAESHTCHTAVTMKFHTANLSCFMSDAWLSVVKDHGYSVT